MRTSLLIMLLVLSCFLPGQSPEHLSQDGAASTMIQPWNLIANSLVRLVEAMPVEKFSFVPRSGEFTGVRSFGEQVKHVACANFAFFNQIEGQTPPADCAAGGPDPAKSKDEILKYLRDSFDYGRGILASLDQKSCFELVEGPYGGRRTKLGMVMMAIWHASDHYGQLVVYLRMNGIVPPASQRK